MPVITVHLSKITPEQQKPKLKLSYKNEAKYITTRLPVIDVYFEENQMGLFPDRNDIVLLIEAHDKKGNVVGEAKTGGVVNPATGTILIKPGDHIQVTLRMQVEYEGIFAVKVMNPSTFTVYCKLELKTDYVV